MAKKPSLTLGLPTYTRMGAYKGKGISEGQAEIVRKAAARKKAELSKRLKSKRFVDRLAKQGVEVGDDVLKHVDEVVKATPVYATKNVPKGTFGVFERRGGDAGTKTKHRRLERQKQRVSVNPSGLTPKAIRRVTSHELEHGLDESFRDASPGMSLSEAQGTLLENIGGKDFDTDHTRTDIMELRDEIGSEDITPDLIKTFLGQHKGASLWALPRWQQMLHRAVKENPGKSHKEIADMINSVAIRKQQKKDTRRA
tara:strand:- start:199 stop:963 length:765 start_codon:yes stop_codon:yes gene_type:complete